MGIKFLFTLIEYQIKNQLIIWFPIMNTRMSVTKCDPEVWNKWKTNTAKVETANSIFCLSGRKHQQHATRSWQFNLTLLHILFDVIRLK